MAETLYDIYRREAERSGEQPLGSDEVADAWRQYVFDRASEHRIEVVHQRWRIQLHHSVGRTGGLAWLTGDHLEYLKGQSLQVWDEDIPATLFSWVEDLRFAEDIYVLVPAEIHLAEVRTVVFIDPPSEEGEQGRP
jgi:hypothetical protein